MDDLPDDCLLTIFEYISEPKTLINCAKVSKRWNFLIKYRLRRVKYLFEREICAERRFSLLYNGPVNPKNEYFLPGLLSVLPNLKIISFGLNSWMDSNPKWVDITAEALANADSLQGIILDGFSKSIVMQLPANLEMLSTYETTIKVQPYTKIKQLHSGDYFFNEYGHCFPNLERLNIEILDDPIAWIGLCINKSYLLANLKILEIDSTCYCWNIIENNACRLIDICPQLQSAHIRIRSNQLLPNKFTKHKNLKDLVVTYVAFGTDSPFYHLDIKSMVKRYPNLRHLAVRYIRKFKDKESMASEFRFDHQIYLEYSQHRFLKGFLQHLPKEIASLLPQLVLLDMRGLVGINRDAADYLHEYCRNSRRKVFFYYGSPCNKLIIDDWPEFSPTFTKICRGFDFMQNCFLKNFDTLPHFLEPIPLRNE